MNKTSIDASIDLVKKSYDYNYKGEWAAGFIETSIYLNKYIKQQYKKDLFFIDYTVLQTGYSPGSVPRHVMLIDLKQSPDNNFHQINKKTVKHELLPYINRYKKSNKRFHFYDISMLYKNPKTKEIEGHSASALYDKGTKQVDFFNTVSSGTTNLKFYHHQFELFFQAIYGKDIVLNYSQICILFGKKEFENQCIDLYKNGKFMINGPCVIWTLWFLDTRLKNKSLSRNQVISRALREFTKNKKLICEVIINYAIFIDKLISKYTLKVNIDKKKVIIKKKKTQLKN